MEHFDIVIVGAGRSLSDSCLASRLLNLHSDTYSGWHGLAMAKTYLEAHPNTDLLVLDYADSVGGTWASERLYPGVCLFEFLSRAPC